MEPNNMLNSDYVLSLICNQFLKNCNLMSHSVSMISPPHHKLAYQRVLHCSSSSRKLLLHYSGHILSDSNPLLPLVPAPCIYPPGVSYVTTEAP